MGSSWRIGVEPAERTRWWKRRPAATRSCSFCGQTSDPGQLVNGPGVTICRTCIALAADILTTRQPSKHHPFEDVRQAGQRARP
jgi:hypothetical protein